MTDIERIESELREIKAILMILVPSYGEIERNAADIFGWNKAKENAIIAPKARGINAKGRRNISKTNLREPS